MSNNPQPRNLDHSQANPELLGELPAAPCDDPFVGTLLSGKYEILSRLGSGGMSKVYKAQDKLVGRIVAIKVLLPHYDENTLMRFQKEARAIGRLDHANIIRIHEFNSSEEGQPYLVMDYFEGLTLAQRIAKETQLPTDEVIDIFLDVCAGLGHAHAQGIVHRDIKPSNILLADVGGKMVAKILDFGIAQIAQTDQKLTRTGEVFGSPLYMSPEQGVGKQLDARSDIYSLGCALFESLCGVPPHQGETAIATILAHQTDAPQAMRNASLGRTFPDLLEQTVAKCLEKSPDKRYQSIEELADDLRQAKHSLLHPAPTPATKPKTVQPSRSRWSQIVVLSMLSLTVVASFIGFHQMQKQAPTPQPAISSSPPARVEPAKLASELPDLYLSEGNQDKEVQLMYKQRPNQDRVNVKHFRLSEHGLETLGKFKMMTKLDLAGAEFPAVDDAGGFSHLANSGIQELHVENTAFNKTCLEALGRLPKLVFLDLSHCDLDNQGFRFLKRMPLLRTIVMRDMSINDDCFDQLALIPRLEKLYMSNNKFLTGANFSDLKAAEHLHVMDISGTAIDDDALKQLTKVPDLFTLDISGTKITDHGLKEISASPSLLHLYLAQTNVTSKGLRHLAKMKRLNEVRIFACPNVTDSDLENLQTLRPDLKINRIPDPKR